MVLSQELLQGGGVQQRDVPAGDDDGPGQVLGQGGQTAGHGPPGAGDLVLVGRDGVGGDSARWATTASRSWRTTTTR